MGTIIMSILGFGVLLIVLLAGVLFLLNLVAVLGLMIGVCKDLFSPSRPPEVKAG